MTSLATRYESGEWAEVWAEIRQLGPVPHARQTEVEDVARSTMKRAGIQIGRIVEVLLALGFEPASSGIPVVTPPPCDVSERVAKLELLLGPLPAALKASMGEIGAVSLLGDCPAIGLYYHQPPPARVSTMPPGSDYPDPLWLPCVDQLESEWDERGHDLLELSTSSFEFAPDELHKANISGAAHDIWLPDTHADPVLLGVVGRPSITVVEYLRLSVAWGGFPGYSFGLAPRPRALEQLTSSPLF